MKGHIDGTSAKVSVEVSNQFNHFSERIKHSKNKQQGDKSNSTRMIEMIFESKIFQKKEKQNWVILAGPRGNVVPSPFVQCIYRQIFREKNL